MSRKIERFQTPKNTQGEKLEINPDGPNKCIGSITGGILHSYVKYFAKVFPVAKEDLFLPPLIEQLPDKLLNPTNLLCFYLYNLWLSSMFGPETGLPFFLTSCGVRYESSTQTFFSVPRNPRWYNVPAQGLSAYLSYVAIHQMALTGGKGR